MKDSKYMPITDGLKRILKISNITMRDEGKYSCKVQEHMTTAKLYVARKYELI